MKLGRANAPDTDETDVVGKLHVSTLAISLSYPVSVRATSEMPSDNRLLCRLANDHHFRILEFCIFACTSVIYSGYGCRFYNVDLR